MSVKYTRTCVGMCLAVCVSAAETGGISLRSRKVASHVASGSRSSRTPETASTSPERLSNSRRQDHRLVTKVLDGSHDRRARVSRSTKAVLEAGQRHADPSEHAAGLCAHRSLTLATAAQPLQQEGEERQRNCEGGADTLEPVGQRRTVNDLLQCLRHRSVRTDTPGDTEGRRPPVWQATTHSHSHHTRASHRSPTCGQPTNLWTPPVGTGHNNPA